MKETHADVAKIERQKNASTFQILFKVSRLVNEIAIARLREVSGIESLRTSHTALLPHLSFEGTRVTELARALGVTKQAVTPLIDELEELGVIERIPDPADGRAKLVRFSKRGKKGLLVGLGELMELENAARKEIGSEDMKALRGALTKLLAWAEAQQAPEE